MFEPTTLQKLFLLKKDLLDLIMLYYIYICTTEKLRLIRAKVKKLRVKTFMQNLLNENFTV